MEFFFQYLKPVSTNNIYRGMGKSRCKSTEYKYLEQVVKFKVLSQGRLVRDFVGDPELWKAPVKVDLVFHIPKDKLFTKKGKISKTSGDLDNFQKSIIDAVFNNVGLNDSFVSEINAKKICSNDSEYHISFKISEMNMEVLDSLETDF